jgi:hypothetical protein
MKIHNRTSLLILYKHCYCSEIKKKLIVVLRPEHQRKCETALMCELYISPLGTASATGIGLSGRHWCRKGIEVREVKRICASGYPLTRKLQQSWRTGSWIKVRMLLRFLLEHSLLCRLKDIWCAKPWKNSKPGIVPKRMNYFSVRICGNFRISL